jgi:hypothetical protein
MLLYVLLSCYCCSMRDDKLEEEPMQSGAIVGQNSKWMRQPSPTDGASSAVDMER